MKTFEQAQKEYFALASSITVDDMLNGNDELDARIAKAEAAMDRAQRTAEVRAAAKAIKRERVIL